MDNQVIDSFETEERRQDQPKTEPLSDRGKSAMQGKDTGKQIDWIDRGIIDVPVAQISLPEGVSNPSDFGHHISWEDARHHTKQLPEVQAEVNKGKTRDDFYQEDRENGIIGTYGKTGTYDLFYSQSDPVKLSKQGEHYEIESGRHRVYAAKELSLNTIPARVVEKIN